MSNIFKFNNLDDALEIHMDVNNEAHCPNCRSKFKHLLQHFNTNVLCRSIIANFANFRDEYQVFANRRRQTLHRKKKIETDAEELHRTESKKKKHQREKLFYNNAEELDSTKANKKRHQREKRLKNNAEELHSTEANKKKHQR